MTETQTNRSREERLNDLMKKVANSEIASIQKTVTRIVQIINDPRSTVKDLKDLIEIDPPLSARVLKLSNSAYYGFGKQASGVQEAIIRIGFDAIRELALSQKVCEVFEDSVKRDNFSRNGLWKHSVATALCAKLIYRREFRDRGGNIYVAGLLHNIGLIIIDQFYSTEFHLILNEAETKKQNLKDAEENILGFNHADIGEAVGKEWGFPEELTAGINCHHSCSDVPSEFQRFAMVMQLAVFSCHKLNFGFNDAPYVNESDFQSILVKLGLKERAIEEILVSVVEEINRMEEMDLF